MKTDLSIIQSKYKETTAINTKFALVWKQNKLEGTGIGKTVVGRDI